MAQQQYQIHVKGHLDQQLWSNWLEGLIITHLENGESLLSGVLADQAALYGVLHKLEVSVYSFLLCVVCFLMKPLLHHQYNDIAQRKESRNAWHNIVDS